MAEEAGLGMGAGIAIGFGVAAICTGALMVAAAHGYAAQKGNEARRGWNLVPLAVASRDLTPGTRLVAADFALTPVPDQLATVSTFPQGKAPTLVGQRLGVGVVRGEILVAGHFTRRRPAKACVDWVRKLAGKAGVTDDAQVQRALQSMDRNADEMDLR